MHADDSEESASLHAPTRPLPTTLSFTFDLQVDLVFSFAQDVGGDTGVDALVLFAGHLDLQTAVLIDVVVATIQVASLPVLKPHNRAAERRILRKHGAQRGGAAPPRETARAGGGAPCQEPEPPATGRPWQVPALLCPLSPSSKPFRVPGLAEHL